MNDLVTVSTARSIQEIEEIRESWEKLDAFPLAQIDYFLTRVKFSDSICRPHIILLSRGNTPTALAVGRVENLRKSFRIGPILEYHSTIKTMWFDVGCIMGNLTLENSRIIVKEIISALKNREADTAYFSEVSTASSVYQYVRSIPGFLFRDYFPNIQGHYRLTLPSSKDYFYKSRKKAKNLRRIGNRLNRVFDGAVKVQCFRSEEDVDTLCKDADSISRNTYQYASGGGFSNNMETLHCLTELARGGWLLAYILYLDNKPCAFEGGVFFDETYFADYCGYDQDYRKYEIGTYLEIKVIESLCDTPEFKYYDFGWMDTFHKNRYCDIMLEEANCHIYQPTIKGFFLNGKRVMYHVGKMGVKRIASSYLNSRHRERDTR